jgi:hypothetical protein
LFFTSLSRSLLVVFCPNAELNTPPRIPRFSYIMLPHAVLLVAFTARLASGALHSFAARAIVALGPRGTCPAMQETLYELQPVYYSSFIPRNTIIDPLHDGHSIMISNAPTALILQTYITVVITRQGNGFSDGTALGQGGNAATNHVTPTTGNGPTLSPLTLRGPSRFSSAATISNTLTITNSPVVVNGQTITAGASAVTINGTPVSLAVGSTALVIGIQTVQPDSGNSALAAQTIALTPSIQNLMVAGQVIFPGEVTTINGIQIIYAADGGYAIIGIQTIFPGFGTATVAGSAVSLAGNGDAINPGAGASVAAAASASSTDSLPPLSIGAGVPSGTFTSFPSESPVLLAFNDFNVANQRVKRGQGAAVSGPAAATTASAVSVVNLASLSSTAPPSGQTENTVAASNCDDATPFILSEGLLLNDGSAVGKTRFTPTAVLGQLTDPPIDQVNKTFSVQNGILHWDTDDLGSALFWSCSGTIYAGFPQAPDDACTSIVLGVIEAQACEAKVIEASAAAPTASAAAASNVIPTLVPSISFRTSSFAISLPSSDITSLLSLSVRLSTSTRNVFSTGSSTFATSVSPSISVFKTLVKSGVGNPSTSLLITASISGTLSIPSMSQTTASLSNSSSLLTAPDAATMPSSQVLTVYSTDSATSRSMFTIFPSSISDGSQSSATTPASSQSASVLSPVSSDLIGSDGAVSITDSLSLPSSSGSSPTNTVSVTFPQMLPSATSLSIGASTLSNNSSDNPTLNASNVPSSVAASDAFSTSMDPVTLEISLMPSMSLTTFGTDTKVSKSSSTLVSSSQALPSTQMSLPSTSGTSGTFLTLGPTALQTQALSTALTINLNSFPSHSPGPQSSSPSSESSVSPTSSASLSSVTTTALGPSTQIPASSSSIGPAVSTVFLSSSLGQTPIPTA